MKSIRSAPRSVVVLLGACCPNASAAVSAAAIFERSLSLEFLRNHSAEFARLPAVLHLGNKPPRCAQLDGAR